MSMSKTTDAAFAAALRPVAEAIIRAEDVRRDEEHDRTHDPGGRLRADRVTGRLPGNTTGVIAPETVQVPPSALSSSENLRDHLTDVTAAVLARLTLEQVQDAAATMLLAGAGVTLVYDDTAGTLTVSASGTTWSVLTNGDPADPQLVWTDDGDVIMVAGG